MNVANGSGLCLFGALLGVHRLPIFEWLNAATGWDKKPEDYMLIGERIQTLKQAFNIKHGVDPRKNKSSARSLGEPILTEGANKNRRVAIDELMREYWHQFHWNTQTGKPGKRIMEDLGIV